MTLFCRYINSDNKLVEKTTDQILILITKESNKVIIAELIYHRLYDRFLKIFFFEPEIFEEYLVDKERIKKDKFHYEYKSGFIMMSSACLLIETLASFLQGNNKTIGPGNDNFKVFFAKCKAYENELKLFSEQNIYKSIRNGLLHQGESYDKYKIVREGSLFNSSEKKINAKLFVDHLKSFLNSYKNELQDKDTKWDSETWDNCRTKIRYIVNN